MAPGLARRSADIPLQQLLDAQRVPTAPRARRASVGGLVPTAPGAEGEMVPYNPRARRMSTVITSQRMLPTEASALPLSALLTIPEEGMHSSAYLPVCSLHASLQNAVMHIDTCLGLSSALASCLSSSSCTATGAQHAAPLLGRRILCTLGCDCPSTDLWPGLARSL